MLLPQDGELIDFNLSYIIKLLGNCIATMPEWSLWKKINYINYKDDFYKERFNLKNKLRNLYGKMIAY